MCERTLIAFCARSFSPINTSWVMNFLAIIGVIAFLWVCAEVFEKLATVTTR